MSSMGGTKQLYAVLAIVVIVAAASIVALLLLQDTTPSSTTPLVTLKGSDGTNHTLTKEELLDMIPVERIGSYENSFNNTRGSGEYIGAKLSDILNLVGGMEPDDIIVVNAFDGYSQTFTYDNVYPNETQYDIQGEFVLAYSFNGTILPEYVEGPRLMFLPEDGLFSNDDAALVIDPEYSCGAAGPKLVTNVTGIIVKNRPASVPVNFSNTDNKLVCGVLSELPAIIASDSYRTSSSELY